MKKISVNEIYRPQILAKSIVTDTGTVLLYEGAEVRGDHIEKLIENNIEEIYVEDEADISGRADVFSIEAIEHESIESIKNAINKVVQQDDAESAAVIEKAAADIILNIISNKEVYGCMVDVKRSNPDIYTHMVDVASISTIMGIKCGFSQTQLNDIALGALLHDAGLCKVTVPFYDVDIDKMPAVDKLNYRKHVIYGYELLHNYSWMTEIAELIVLSHHEYMDGSGYPFHKSGERIPPEVRLVSICDHLNELINGIGFKSKKIPAAVELFRTAETYLFDYDLMSCIIKNIAWYPNGSMVRTNEGEEAIVVSQNRGLPDRPVIRIVKNADGTPCNQNLVKDLAECLTLFLTDIIE